MTRAASQHGVPLNVLYSVGLTETGHKGELSPYISVRSSSQVVASVWFMLAKPRLIIHRRSRAFAHCRENCCDAVATLRTK
jgi:hypothetical protein